MPVQYTAPTFRSIEFGGSKEHEIVRKFDRFVNVEWICLAIFAIFGLIALPFVKDAFIVQQIWSTMCMAFGITP